MNRTDRTIVAQVEVFERGATVGSYVRRGVFMLDPEGHVDLERDASSGEAAGLREMIESGAPARDPRDGLIPSTAGRAFLNAVVAHFASATYYRVRSTEFSPIPDDASEWLRNVLILATTLVRSAHELSAKIMETDPRLAVDIEANAHQVEDLCDELVVSRKHGSSIGV